jgi:hypothetical protein
VSEPTFQELLSDSPHPLLTVAVNCRTEAWDVYIGRPSIFGNPFRIGRGGTREQVVAKYREWLTHANDDRARQVVAAIEAGELDNKRLGCWCKPLPCHGDVLRELVLQRQEVKRE